MYNTRPFSSDAKDREKKAQTQPNPTKLFPYDSGLASTLKNPYESKVSRIPQNNKPVRRKEEIKPPLTAYERPISANSGSDKKKAVKAPLSNPIAEKLGYDMMITGSTAKKRYPSSNPK